MDKESHYYLHSDGQLIGKNVFGTNEQDLKESDFVQAYWLNVKNDNAISYISMLVEVVVTGNFIVKDLPADQNIIIPLGMFAEYYNIKLVESKAGWSASYRKLTCDDGSPLIALSKLFKQMGLVPKPKRKARMSSALEAYEYKNVHDVINEYARKHPLPAPMPDINF